MSDEADRPGSSASIARWAEPLATAAGAVAGLVIVVHLLGGVVMWLRFREADLPADQAVALMTREQMLTVGLRLMVLPALVSGCLAAALVWGSKRRRTVLTPVVKGLAILVVGLLLLTLPASWASLTWTALVLVVVYWWRGFGADRRPRDRQAPAWRLAAVAVLAAAIISLGRQIDQPVQLLQADITLERGTVTKTLHGVFVSADDTAVNIGDTTAHTLTAVPRDSVTAMRLGPPLERAPNPSLLSKLFFHNRWSYTSLRWWCNGQHYSWSQLGELCRTQPKAVAGRRRMLDIRFIPVRIGCPGDARDGCHGFLRVRTHETFSRALGPAAGARRVSFPRDGLEGVAFAMPAGRVREVCVPTSRNERMLLRARPDGPRRRPPVPLDVTLSSDPFGASVMSHATMTLDVGPSGADPSMIIASDCTSAERRTLAARAATTTPARAARVVDGHDLVVLTHGRPQQVRLLGVTGPAGQTGCAARHGVDALLHALFTHPRDSDGDGLADEHAGRARRLQLIPDRRQPGRDRVSRLLRYVRVGGAHETVQERLLRSGWVRLRPAGREPLTLEARLTRAAREGRRARRARAQSC